MLSRPLVQAIITELAPRQAQATYQAAFSLVSDLRDAAGPAIGTWLYALAAGLPWASGAVISIAAAFGLRLQRASTKADRRYVFAEAATSSVITANFASLKGPNEVTIATSVASRPRAIGMRPIRGVLWRASNVYQRPPR
jgi:MFS family permease